MIISRFPSVSASFWGLNRAWCRCDPGFLHEILSSDSGRSEGQANVLCQEGPWRSLSEYMIILYIYVYLGKL